MPEPCSALFYMAPTRTESFVNKVIMSKSVTGMRRRIRRKTRMIMWLVQERGTTRKTVQMLVVYSITTMAAWKLEENHNQG